MVTILIFQDVQTRVNGLGRIWAPEEFNLMLFYSLNDRYTVSRSGFLGRTFSIQDDRSSVHQQTNRSSLVTTSFLFHKTSPSFILDYSTIIRVPSLLIK